jgi:hypothetical protein
VDLTGARVLAHRAAVQGLHGTDPDAVLPLGVVDSPPKTGAAALGVRGRCQGTEDTADLVRVLSLRGAPHLHRRDDLPAPRRQLRPRTPRQLAAWCGAHPTPDLEHSPGALVLHGRVAGAWRHEFHGRTVTFQLTGWSKVKGTARRAIKDQAAVPAGVWGGDALEPDVVEW